MEFSERSKYVLVDSVKELMKTIPLDNITVTKIVENCGTTRQTFYRNFTDKYDLVNWYFDKIIQKTIKQMGISLTLQEGLIKKFQLMKEDKDFFVSAFSSSDYNSLLSYDCSCILKFYTDIARKKYQESLSEKILFLLEFYCKGSMELTSEWVKKGMKLSPEVMAELLVDAMPQRLHEYLSDLSGYNVT